MRSSLNIVNYIIGSDISTESLDVAQINQTNYNVKNLVLLEHDILTNSFYCGLITWKGRTTKSSYKSIISKRLFNQVQLSNHLIT